MISNQYQRQTVFSEFTARTLRTAAGMILREQAKTIAAYLNFRTGHISNSLYEAFLVTKSGSGANLHFNYLIDLRFLDIKKTASGRKKKVYAAVYNRPLWGYVYGYTFGTLRYGLTQSVESEIIDIIRESYKIPFTQ